MFIISTSFSKPSLYIKFCPEIIEHPPKMIF